MLAWREQHRSAKSMTELRNALSSLQDLIAQIQKNTAISAEAKLAQKTLVARLRDTEMPRWNPTLVTVSSSFATDADRQWRCGVFAWAFGQTNAARQLFDAACSAKPSYKEARKFFDQTKP